MSNFLEVLKTRIARDSRSGFGEHPDPGLIAAHAEGCLDKQERAAIVRHFATCADCRDLLSHSLAAAPLASHRHPRENFTRKTWPAWGIAALGATACLLAIIGIRYMRTDAVPAPPVQMARQKTEPLPDVPRLQIPSPAAPQERRPVRQLREALPKRR